MSSRNFKLMAVLACVVCMVVGTAAPAQDSEGSVASFLETLNLSGSLDLAYTYNFNNTDNPTVALGPLGTLRPLGGENPARVFDRFHNEFTVHNAILNIERPVSDDQWFGFMLTPAIGVDSQVTAGGGFDFGVGLSDVNQSVDFDLLQAHVAMYVPSDIAVLGGTKIKLGKFYTTAGAEFIPSQENTMFSRSFLFGNAIPYTHTGVIAETPLVEREDGGELIGMSLGFVNGWDSLRSTNDGHAGLASLRFGPCEYMETSLNYIFGVVDRLGVGDNNDLSHLLDLVATARLFDTGLSLSANFDWYGDENTAGGGPYANYYGFAGIIRFDFANYIFDAAAEDMYLAMRGEFFDDPDGFITGGDAQLWDLTWTLGYKPADYVLLRAEVRFDKANADVFENGAREHQTTIAFNTVFMF